MESSGWGTFDCLLIIMTFLLRARVSSSRMGTSVGSQQRTNRETGRPVRLSPRCRCGVSFFFSSFHFFFIFSVLRLGAARLEKGKIVSLV